MDGFQLTIILAGSYVALSGILILVRRRPFIIRARYQPAFIVVLVVPITYSAMSRIINWALHGVAFDVDDLFNFARFILLVAGYLALLRSTRTVWNTNEWLHRIALKRTGLGKLRRNVGKNTFAQYSRGFQRNAAYHFEFRDSACRLIVTKARMGQITMFSQGACSWQDMEELETALNDVYGQFKQSTSWVWGVLALLVGAFFMFAGYMQ